MTNSPKCSTRPKNSPTSGFTLIELLVVISVIMLLAALAMPVLMRAARQARSVLCLSNLKQLATAFRSYSTNHDGILPATAACRMPTWVMPIDPYIDREAAFEAAPKGTLYPYFRDPKLVLCPIDRDGNGKFSYAVPNNIGYRIMDDVENATKALLIIEEDPIYYLNNREAGFACADRPARRHGGRTAHASFDGSAYLTLFNEGHTARDFIIDPWGYPCGFITW